MDRIQGGLMSEIEYKEIHEFTKEDLEDLFCLWSGLQVIFPKSFK